MNRFSVAVTLLVALAASTGTNAFVGQSSPSLSQLRNVAAGDAAVDGQRRLVITKKQTKQAGDGVEIPYGEESRKYRRTVFTHDDWVKFRSPDQTWRNLGNFATSGIYKNISNEVTACALVATFVMLFNMVFGEYVDFDGVKHAGILSGTLPAIGLPLTGFTLSGSSLGLLLGFRVNQAYKRWDEARKNWGMNINHTRDLVRMGNAFYSMDGVTPEQRQEDLNSLALATWSFVRAMKRHLSPEGEDEAEFKTELFEKLPAAQAQGIIDAAHRPNRALFDLSCAIENLNCNMLRKNEIHKAATIFEDNLGSSERLLTSPIPLFYSRHTARFLSVWLLLLPLALYEPFKGTWNHVGMIPATAAISVFLFGIEEVATQLEEPFTVLPMQGFCDKIYNWCMENASFTPGDNGMDVNRASKEQSAIYFDSDGGRGSTLVASNPVFYDEPQAAPAPVQNIANGVPGAQYNDPSQWSGQSYNPGG